MIETQQDKYSWIKLAPCPLCGTLRISFQTFLLTNECYVVCRECGCTLPVTIPPIDMETETERQYHYRALKIAKSKWNARRKDIELPVHELIL